MHSPHQKPIDVRSPSALAIVRDEPGTAPDQADVLDPCATRSGARHEPHGARHARHLEPRTQAGPGSLLRQLSLRATALGVTFILGAYSATSTMRPSAWNWARRSVRQVSHGP